MRHGTIVRCRRDVKPQDWRSRRGPDAGGRPLHARRHPRLPRGCICGTPDDFAGLDSLASQILAFERHYNAAATPFGWKFTRTDLDQLLTGSPGTTLGNAPAPGSMMIPGELTGPTT